MRPFVLFFCVINFSSFASGNRTKDVSILSECLWNQELYYGDKVDCNDLFHHYQPQKNLNKVSKRELRIGSFNLYRLGLRDTQLKDIGFLAEMINRRWDLVAVSELHHNMSLPLRANARAMRAYLEGMDRSLVQKSYRRPGYFKLLQKLQKKDPNWGLILAPLGQGTTNELFGFFYRRQVVQPIASKYCQPKLRSALKKPISIFGHLHEEFPRGFQRYQDPYKRPFVSPASKAGALACLMNFKGMAKATTARIPFVGRFRSGKMDFSLIALHARFRSPNTVKGVCEDACQLSLQKMKKAVGQQTGIANLPNMEVARFYEADVALKESQKISKAEKDTDVILAGDFNLEYGAEATRGRTEVWDAILKRSREKTLLVHERTSISKSGGLSQSYDHFIFTPHKGDLKACAPSTAKSVDFTAPSFKNANRFQKFRRAQSRSGILESYLSQLKNSYEVVDHVAYPRWDMSASEKRKFLKTFPDKEVVKRQRDLERANRRRFRNCLTGEVETGSVGDVIENNLYCRIFFQLPSSDEKIVLRKQPYRLFTELVSDHLPIEMTCRN